MTKRILLYFGNYEDKKESVEHVLQELHLEYQILADEDLLETTGYLMQLPNFSKQKNGISTHYESDLMILKDIEDEEISNMNQLMKSLGVAMQRKAMLTEHNQHWTIGNLLREIEKEHEYFIYVDKIQTLLTQSAELIIEDYTKASWATYEYAFHKAYACISKESSYEEIKECYSALVDALHNLQKA